MKVTRRHSRRRPLALARSGNACSAEELAQLRKLGAVGDVCLHFCDAGGRPVLSELDERVVGIGPGQLRAVRRTVAVASGWRKHAAIRGAVRSGLVRILVTNEPPPRRSLPRSPETQRRPG